MKKILTIQTGQPSVVLRALADRSDDVAYFEAIEEDRRHIDQFGNTVSEKYQTLEDVTRARRDSREKIRMGIWDSNTFVGSINASPNVEKSEVEIGYWLRASATGKGYATLAVKTFTAYLEPMFDRIYAEVHPLNIKSSQVLVRSGYTRVGMELREWGLATIFEFIR